MTTAIIICIAYRGTSQPATSFANVSATIVTPLTIAKNENIDFGNVGVRSLTGGNVVLSPEGTRSATKGVILRHDKGTVTAADFTVMGSIAYTYTIAFPCSVVLLNENGAETMLASGFTSTPNLTGFLAGGMQRIRIGASLALNAGQKPGHYSSHDFEVMVYYN